MNQIGQAASDAGVSVGEFVRRAVDVAIDDAARREKQKGFLEFLDTIEPIDFGGPDGVIDAIHEVRERKFFRDEESA